MASGSQEPQRNQEYTGLHQVVADIASGGDNLALLAMRSGEDPERWTGAELARTVCRLAAGLRAEGLEPGDHVALIASSSPRWIITCLAILHAGAVAVPVDAQFPEDILDHVLSDCDARWIAVDDATQQRVDACAGAGERRRLRLHAEEGEDAWPALLADAEMEAVERTPDDRAVLFYTSGTTGKPKGVPLSQRNIGYQMQLVADTGLLGSDDTILLPLPLHHVYPFVIGMLSPLRLHSALVLPASFTGPAVIQAIREGGCTVVIGVPRLYRALVQGVETRINDAPLLVRPILRAALATSSVLRRRCGVRLGRILLRPIHQRLGPSLQLMASGGSPLDAELGWQLEGLGYRVAIGYGLTETSPLLTLTDPGDGQFATTGRPMPGTEIRIDQDALPEDPANGEVQARGPGVFAGYHHRPDEDAESFTEDGWYRTGDLGRIDDSGRLRLGGRKSTMLVTPGGENVQPETVEGAYEEHHHISEIGVLQKGDDLVALVVPEREAVPADGSVDAVIARALRERGRQLPSYQRLTDHRVTTTPLPRTRLGKIRRGALEEAYDQGGGDGGNTGGGPARIDDLPREDQQLLQQDGPRAVWDLLAERYPDSNLHPDADLGLDLGLDSMAWLDLTLSIRAKTGVELDERTIAELDSVRSLLQAIGQRAGAAPAGEIGDVQAGPSPVREPEEHLNDEQRRYLRPLTSWQAALNRSIHGILRIALRDCWQLQVEGLQHVPKRGPCIIAPNHTSLVDPFVVTAALDGRRLAKVWWVGFVGAAFGNPITRGISRLGRTVPVDPRGGAASSLAVGSKLLQDGHMLVWFPEGQRSWEGTLQPFRPGLGLLAAEHRVPVIPVAIQGAHDVLPRGSNRIRRARVRIRFGPAIDPADWPDADTDEVPERIARAVHEAVRLLGAPMAED